MLGLSKEQLAQFDKEGMLCIPDFLTSEESERLKESAHLLLKNFDVESHPRTQFKTGENDHIGDQYFFDSSDNISYFFDVDAFDKDGTLRFPKEMAVNKIGHGLHMQDKLYHDITFDNRVKAIAKSLEYEDPRVLQSMLIFKNPVAKKGEAGRDNEVPSHTDGTFLFTKPQSALGFWFALEDCTVENGCLSYNPGSHKVFPITKRFVRVNGGKSGCNFMDVEYSKEPDREDNSDDYKLVECKAGSLILIHNAVLHKSEKNFLDKSRFAYAFHLIEGRTDYDDLNWLQVPSTGGSNFLKLYEE